MLETGKIKKVRWEFTRRDNRKRVEEIFAIKKQDIQDDILCVNNSLSRNDCPKMPKNGLTRKVPLLPQVKKLLLKIETDSDFIFGNKMNEKILLAGLYSNLAALGIDYKKRNIVFHSWRYFYALKHHREN